MIAWTSGQLFAVGTTGFVFGAAFVGFLVCRNRKASNQDSDPAWSLLARWERWTIIGLVIFFSFAMIRIAFVVDWSKW